VLPGGFDLLTERIGFSLAFSMLCSSTFAFTSETFRLYREAFQRPLEMSDNFAQPFGDGSMFEQVCAGILDFRFGSRGY